MLQKWVHCGDHLEAKYKVSVYRLSDKTIVFNGTVREVAKFLNVRKEYVWNALHYKRKIMNKTYTLRISHEC